jgi:hypothetical protein
VAVAVADTRVQVVLVVALVLAQEAVGLVGLMAATLQ